MVNLEGIYEVVSEVAQDWEPADVVSAGRATGHRVVVTGLGPVSSIGIGVASFAEGLRGRAQRGAPIASFDTTGFASHQRLRGRRLRPGAVVRAWTRRQLGRAAAVLRVRRRGWRCRTPGIDPADLADRPRRRLGGHHRRRVAGPRPAHRDRACATGPADVPPERGRAGCRRAGCPPRSHRSSGSPTSRRSPCRPPAPPATTRSATRYDAVRLRRGRTTRSAAAPTRCAARPSPASTGSAPSRPRCCQPFDGDRKGILTGEGAGHAGPGDAGAAPARGARMLRRGARLRAQLRRHPPGRAGPGQHRRAACGARTPTPA